MENNKLISLSVADFAGVLASDAPAPGGGSVAALAGALGAALSSMVAKLTLCKEKYDDHREQTESIKTLADDLAARLIKAVDADTEAYTLVSDAFAMPKGTDEEKAARSAAIQSGMKACTESPLAIMEMSLEALEMISSQASCFNTNTASDLGVSALSLCTALRGAWLNVLINIGSLKDKELAASFRAKGEAILEKGEALSDSVYKSMLQIVQE